MAIDVTKKGDIEWSFTDCITNKTRIKKIVVRNKRKEIREN